MSPPKFSTDTSREEALMTVVSTPRTFWLLGPSTASATTTRESRPSLEGTVEDGFIKNLLDKRVGAID
jgi:hypothetical protein